MTMSDNFNKLFIDINMIDGVIKEYPECTKVIGPDKIKDGYHRYTIIKDGNPAFLDFFFRNDGRTTINWKVGSNQELSLNVASYVREKCQIQIRDNQPISLKGFPIDHLDALIKYLCEEIGASIEDHNKTDTQDRIVIRGPFKDTITITHYSNGTFLLQGSPLHLFNEVRYFLSIVLPYDHIVEEQIKTFKVEIDNQAIQYEFENILPKSHAYLDDVTKKLLRTSIIMKKVSLPLDDYTSFVFPALKGLECYLKQLFNDHGIIISKQDGFGEHMVPSGAQFVIKPETKGKIKCTQTCKAIETTYPFYNRERHSLFHAEGVVSSTRVIEKRSEADNIVDQALRIIESTCPTKE